jgi:hypothetical protein
LHLVTIIETTIRGRVSLLGIGEMGEGDSLVGNDNLKRVTKEALKPPTQ